MKRMTDTRVLRFGVLALAILPLVQPAVLHAQSHDHHAHGASQEKPASPPAASPSDTTVLDDGDHSKMDHSGMGHEGMDHSKMDHSGMDHLSMDHSGMDHAAMGHASPAASEPKTPIPPITDADRAAANRPLHHAMSHGGGIHQFYRFDRLEAWGEDHGTGLHWEAEGWIGTDTDRLWLRSEGERENGRTQGADLELLYGRSISPWWDVVAGVRHDFGPEASRTFAAIGIMGLAPQKFEVEATLYAGSGGQTALVLEAERELLITNRLILQPVVEIEVHGRNERERGIGSGLSGIETGLRLRYEVTRRFAPYIGIVHERAFGNTADLKREEGDGIEDTRVVAGVRIWF